MSRAILANESLGRLAGGIAHDLNNVLAAVVGYANLLAYDKTNDDPALADIRQILTSAERGAKLTRQLLVWSRQQVMSPRAVVVARFVSEHTDLWRRLLGVPLAIVVDDTEALGTVRLDPNELDLVLLGMIASVRTRNHATDPVTLRLTPRVLDDREASAHDVAPGAYALFSFVSNATPLPEDWRVTPTLELGAAYQVVRQMGGDLSTEDTGTLTLMLPMISTVLPRAAATPPRPATIVVVDDEEIVRVSIARLLRTAGYTVIEAANAGEALLLVEDANTTIDLMIADVAMPRVSGPMLAERLRRDHPGLPTVFLSGHDPNGATHTPNVGDPWLPKPVNPTQLLDTVASSLR